MQWQHVIGWAGPILRNVAVSVQILLRAYIKTAATVSGVLQPGMNDTAHVPISPLPASIEQQEHLAERAKSVRQSGLGDHLRARTCH